MIELVDLYKNAFVGSIYPDTLIKILRDQYEGIKVKSCIGSSIILSNGMVLNCISEYYTCDGSKNVVATNNPYLKCNSIRNHYGISDQVGQVECKNCHIKAILMEKAGQLERKKNKRKLKR